MPSRFLNKAPAVSVVIPAYNAETFLGVTLASVARQTFRDFEIIVVDDGSKDQTARVAEEFLTKQKIPGRCIQQENRKIAGARNAGIQAAKGDFIALLDHDDLWMPQKLNRMIAIVKKYSDCILYWHQILVVGSNYSYKPLPPSALKERPFEDLLFHGFTISPSASLFPKSSWLKAKGFREGQEFNTVEDFDFWLRLGQLGKFCFVPEILAEVSRHAAGASQNIIYHHQNMERAVLHHLEPYLSGVFGAGRKKKAMRRLSVVYRSCLGQLIRYKTNSDYQKKMAYLMLKTWPWNLKNLFLWVRWKIGKI